MKFINGNDPHTNRTYVVRSEYKGVIMALKYIYKGHHIFKTCL